MMDERKPRSLSLDLRSMLLQLRSQPAVVGTIFVAVLIGTFLNAGAPRLLEEVTAEDLHDTVSEPAPAQRNVRVELFGRIGPGPSDDPFRVVESAGDEFAESEMPPSLTAVISEDHLHVESPRFAVSPLPGEEPPHPFPNFLTFIYQDEIERHIRLVDGAMPAPQPAVEILSGDECPRDDSEIAMLTEKLAFGDGEEGLDCTLESVPHYQVAVSGPTAQAMGLEIGQIMLLRPDSTDRLFFGISGDALAYEIVMSISGIIEPDDATLEYWYGDTGLHVPTIQENADLRIIFATGLISPDVYGSIFDTIGLANWNYVWRHFVDPDLVRSADIASLQSELVPFELHYAPISARPTNFRVITQLSELLTAHVEQRTETVSMMSLSVSGLFLVVVVVTFMLAVLMTERQRAGIVLLRNRGASAGQLTLTRTYEGLILSAPAAVLGYWLAASFLSGTDGLDSYRVTTALVAATTAVMIAAAVPVFTRRLGSLQRTAEARVPRHSARRLVVEVLVLVIAGGATVLLRRRGQIDEPVGVTRFDLLLASTPALIGMAAGIVTIWIFPLAISFLAWTGSKWRGLVVFVGFRRVLGQSGPGWLPILVIVICTATAAFASVTRTSISAGQEASSWQAVGSDYTVKGTANLSLPTSIDFDALGPMDDVVFARTFSGGRAENETGGQPAEVKAIDVAGYARITNGTPGQVDFPPSMLTLPGADLGTEANPIPAIVSDYWLSDFSLSPGDLFTLDLGGIEPVAVVREARSRFPDTPLDRPFVVVDLDSLESISDQTLPPTVAYIRAGRDDGSTLVANLNDQAPGARFLSRYEALDDVTGDPFVRWSGLGLMVVFVFSTALAVVAAISAVALGSARRRVDLGYLRTLGLDTRQATLITMIEQAPAVVMGTLVGILAGIGTALVLDPAIDLDAFTGGLAATAMTVHWVAIAWVGLALIAALALAMVIFVLVNRRDDLGRILRVGEEI